MGQNHYSQSLIRILDFGGIVWASQDRYDSLDERLHEAEIAIAAWLKQEGLG